MREPHAERYEWVPSFEPDPREAKLPVWAQALLNDQRAALKRAIKWAEECRMATDPAGSDVIIDRFSAPRVGLGVHTSITFLPAPGADTLDLGAFVVRGTDRPDQLHVSSSTGWLSVLPIGSNSVHIRASSS